MRRTELPQHIASLHILLYKLAVGVRKFVVAAILRRLQANNGQIGNLRRQ